MKGLLSGSNELDGSAKGFVTKKWNKKKESKASPVAVSAPMKVLVVPENDVAFEVSTICTEFSVWWFGRQFRRFYIYKSSFILPITCKCARSFSTVSNACFGPLYLIPSLACR